MNKLFCVVPVLLTAVASPVVGQQLATPSPSTQSPAHIILDTDMDSDCDDAGALALLHALADRGEGKILAIAASSLYRSSVPCIEAINHYYGRPDKLVLRNGPQPLAKAVGWPILAKVVNLQQVLRVGRLKSGVLRPAVHERAREPDQPAPNRAWPIKP